MSTFILNRRGDAAWWTSSNPVLYPGEIGYETDTAKFKMGDGVTAWTLLPYVQGGEGGGVDATTVVKGVVRLGGDLGGTADSPTVTSGANHSHTAAQVSDASALGRSLLTAGTAAAARNALSVGEKATGIGGVIHDGTATGGTRPSGYAFVIWLSLSAGHPRPTNMGTNDIWLSI